jgi:hypothetical protein
MSVYGMIKALRYNEKSEIYERRLDTPVSEGSVDYSMVSPVYLRVMESNPTVCVHTTPLDRNKNGQKGKLNEL